MHERREEETVRGLGIDYPQSRLNTFPLPNVFFLNFPQLLSPQASS